MAFTGNYISQLFRVWVLQGKHNFTASTGNTFKLALYDNTATLNAATESYTATGEITGTGYTAGGATLTNITPAEDNNVGYCSFEDVTWSNASFTARGGLIYNADNNGAVAVLDFGGDRTKANADFVVTFPTNDFLNAIIRIQ
jgi:hypothetical protein